MNWEPFQVTEPGQKPDSHRSLSTPEGLADRLRIVAFAELQARNAFLWAAEQYADAPESLRQAWRQLAAEEQRHFDWIFQRMKELGIDPGARRVSNQLWTSLVACKTAKEFETYISSAEERGRVAGLYFYDQLKEKDPVTAGIFRKIAEEELGHVELVNQIH